MTPDHKAAEIAAIERTIVRIKARLGLVARLAMKLRQEIAAGVATGEDLGGYAAMIEQENDFSKTILVLESEIAVIKDEPERSG